mgnify:CR=1 FL=1
MKLAAPWDESFDRRVRDVDQSDHEELVRLQG